MTEKIDGRSTRTDFSQCGVRQREQTHCKYGHEFTPENTGYQTKRDRKTVRRNRYCKACQRRHMQRKREQPGYKAYEAAKMAQWRKRNPEIYRERWEAVHAAKKQILDEARAGGCSRCEESDLSCLDFHHRDNGATKDADIATMRRFGTARLIAEIAKCDVLCANCHRKHHRDERLKRNSLGGH